MKHRHVAMLASTDVWFWKGDLKEIRALKVWQDSCTYLFLPRLMSADCFHQTLVAGAASKDFLASHMAKTATAIKAYSWGVAPRRVRLTEVCSGRMTSDNLRLSEAQLFMALT